MEEGPEQHAAREEWEQYKRQVCLVLVFARKHGSATWGVGAIPCQDCVHAHTHKHTHTSTHTHTHTNTHTHMQAGKYFPQYLGRDAQDIIGKIFSAYFTFEMIVQVHFALAQTHM